MPWALPETDDALLRLAKGYPYAAPAGSYLYRDGASKPLEGSLDPDLMAGRVPVIAPGSNRAPEQLHRKFGHLAGAASAIPVQIGRAQCRARVFPSVKIWWSAVSLKKN